MRRATRKASRASPSRRWLSTSRFKTEKPVAEWVRPKKKKKVIPEAGETWMPAR